MTGHVGVRTGMISRIYLRSFRSTIVVEMKMMLMAIIIVVLLANIHTVTAFTCFCRVQQAYHKLLYSSIKDDNDIILCSSDPSSQIIATPIQLISKDEYDHINELVNKRSEARWNGDYDKADNIRTTIDDILVSISLSQIIDTIQHDGMVDIISILQENVDIQYKVLVTDYPRSEGGNSSWELEPINNPLFDNIDETEDNVLQLAHASLGLAVSSSEKGVNVNKDVMNELISRTNNRLRVLKQRRALSIFLPGAAVAVGELHGRKAADAILWFALAGIDDDDLFSDLFEIARTELDRFGRNTSCRPKDILHIVERAGMAASIIGTQQLYTTAADCLEYKMKERTNHDINSNDIVWGSLDYRNIIQELRDGSFGLHSDRSLLGLWRFSSRQRKQKQFLYNAAQHFEHTREGNTTKVAEDLNQYNWTEMYTDPSRPLIIDIGCGMGVSLLGLASSQSTKQLSSINHSELQIDWNEYNFLGVDLSRLAIGYARGACRRCGLSSDLHFVVDSAENCLRHISESYPGDAALSMIQFPTPFKFQYENEEVSPSVAKNRSNSQLPSSSTSNNFMVSEKLVSLTYNMLSENNGKLLIQSNCEDVSVYMRNLAVKAGFRSIPFTDSIKELDPVTQRAKKWVECAGERPIGKYWSDNSLLPQKGRTETEVACSIDNKPVHRCLLTAATKF